MLLTSNVEGGLEELQRLGVELAVGGGSHKLVGAVLSRPHVWEELVLEVFPASIRHHQQTIELGGSGQVEMWQSREFRAKRLVNPRFAKVCTL